jgi:hypothetical protein
MINVGVLQTGSKFCHCVFNPGDQIGVNTYETFGSTLGELSGYDLLIP